MLLFQPTTIQNELFPNVPSPKPSLTAARDYVRSTSSNILSAESAQQKKLAKGKATSFDPKKPKKLTVYSARTYPAWQTKCVEVVREMVPGLMQTVLRCGAVEVVDVDEGGKAGTVVGASEKGILDQRREELQPAAQAAVPGQPTFFFENVE